jgi:hypothetical protein
MRLLVWKTKGRTREYGYAAFLVLYGSGPCLMAGGAEGAVRVGLAVVVVMEIQGEGKDDKECSQQERKFPANPDRPALRPRHLRSPVAHFPKGRAIR